MPSGCLVLDWQRPLQAPHTVDEGIGENPSLSDIVIDPHHAVYCSALREGLSCVDTSEESNSAVTTAPDGRQARTRRL